MSAPADESGPAARERVVTRAVIGPRSIEELSAANWDDASINVSVFPVDPATRRPSFRAVDPLSVHITNSGNVGFALSLDEEFRIMLESGLALETVELAHVAGPPLGEGSMVSLEPGQELELLVRFQLPARDRASAIELDLPAPWDYLRWHWELRLDSG